MKRGIFSVHGVYLWEILDWVTVKMLDLTEDKH